ncbi:MAG: DUF4097 family beta strand repeat protein [Planctomycetes bacterium]|nr:DUF4097 family beta strand repeat protein [Planctomycetota bacterium]MBU2458485.1 DUF4097 family beta strand repeat protein [Planctomycetota bacterium]MBU2597025.1 DUF4097 family beta strand repeat protein [Planctomycetota bacterium]
MNRNVFVVFVMSAIIFTSGCISMANEKYTKEVNLTIPAAQAESFKAETHNGNIKVEGSQTTICNLTATIVAKADTEEAAQKIAEQVKIELVPEGNSINVRIEKPSVSGFANVSVSLDANLPAGMNLSLKTHNGKINSSNIIGTIKANTHNGKITVAGAAGGADLLTHNGKIKYTGTLADLKFETHNGDADITCTAQSSTPCDISGKTHNGSISFTAPENFSAAIDLSAHSGSIRVDLPVTVTEKSEERLKGTIGDGRDKLCLKTHNGSIKIK